MKNLLTTIAIFLVGFTTITAQSRIGFTTGIGILDARPESVYIGDKADYVTHEIRYTSSSPVFNAGITYQNKIGWLFMQPSLQYSKYSTQYQIEAFPREYRGKYEANETFQYIDFNAIAGLNINNFRIGGGPIFHYLANYNGSFGDLPNTTIEPKKLTSGFAGQLGYDFAPFSIDFRYEGALKTFGDHIKINDKRSKFKGGPSQFNLAVTYSFGLPKRK